MSPAFEPDSGDGMNGIRRSMSAHPLGDLSRRHYLGLSVLAVLLSWKLLRGISPDPQTWHVHVMFLLVLAFGSLIVLLKNQGRLRTYDMTVPVFVFCIFVIIRTVAFDNYRDSFTSASLVFFAHLLLAALFVKVGDRAFFKAISFLFAVLVGMEILAIVEYANEWEIVDYAAMDALDMEGVAGVEGSYGGRSFILYLFDLEIFQGFWGRLGGVSGTPYATGGLMSAIGAFGLASKRYWLAVLAISAMLLSSTGSAVLAFYVCAAVLYRKNPLMYVPMLAAVPFLLTVFAVKGIDAKNVLGIYLPISVAASPFDFLIAAIIGEGRHSGSIRTEIRVVALLHSLGIVGIACAAAMFEGWFAALRAVRNTPAWMDYRAAGYFMLALFISTLHYPTLFIYPNIAFVVAFLALASSRLRLARRELPASRGVARVPPGLRDAAEA